MITREQALTMARQTLEVGAMLPADAIDCHIADLILQVQQRTAERIRRQIAENAAQYRIDHWEAIADEVLRQAVWIEAWFGLERQKSDGLMVQTSGQPVDDSQHPAYGSVDSQSPKETKTMPEEKPLAGLWRRNPETPEGKYLVQRRDGTVPEWPSLVIGAKDPAAPVAIRAYADEAERLGMNAKYVSDMRDLAGEFERYRASHGDGDPDRGRHRVDDPAIIAKMREGRNA